MPNFRILAIDDDPPSLDLVLCALEQKGVDLLGASDPEEGRNRWSADSFDTAERQRRHAVVDCVAENGERNGLDAVADQLYSSDN